MSEYAGCGRVTGMAETVVDGSWLGGGSDITPWSMVSSVSMPDTASVITGGYSLWLCSGAEERRGGSGVPKMDCTHEATFWSASCGWCTPSAASRMAWM